MTTLLHARQLVVAFCEHYGLTREELAAVMPEREAGANREFDAFFAKRPQTEHTLTEYYRTSTWLRYHLLSSAVNQLAGWGPWFWRQVEKLGVQSLVDVGCGLSALCGPLAGQGYGVVLADIPGEHLGWLPELYPAAMVLDLATLWREPLQADLVVCTEVFEHVLEPEALLERCLTKVRPGGYLATSWTFQGSGGNHLHLAQHEGLDNGGFFADLLTLHGLACVANRGDGLRIWQKTA